MFFWSQIPLVRLAIPLILGIVLYQFEANLLDESALLFGFFFLLICLLSIHSVPYFQTYPNRWLFGALLSILFIFIGFGITHYHQAANKQDPDLRNKKISWLAEVVEGASRTARSVKTIVELKYISLNDKVVEGHNEKVLLYLKQDSASLQLKVGDCILANSRLQEIQGPLNPAQFNYKAFLANRNIYLQTYLSTNWEVISSNNTIFRLSEELRSYFLEVFKAAGLQGEEYAVAAALSLGYKNELNPHIREQYSGSGAMHILAVSGLHIGIIYLLLKWLVRYLDKVKTLKIAKMLLMLAALWSYAILTGLSPSVQRAACMFSFIIIADTAGRQNNIFNSIAASAIFLLVLQPNLLFEVGFQLSYLAVIGIILLHPKIYGLLHFKSSFLDKMWSLMVVSIAAQAATFPLTIYYFHQFPNLFLLTNLIVVPLSFWILSTAILLLLVYSIFSSAWLIGDLLQLLVRVMNFTVEFFYDFPLSVIHGIYIHERTAFLLMAMLMAIVFFFYFFKVRYLIITLSILLIICLGQLWENFQQRNQQLLGIYSLRKHFALAAVDGKRAFVLTDVPLKDRSAKVIKAHLDSIGVDIFRWLQADSAEEYQERNFYFKKGVNAFYIYFNEKELMIPLKTLAKGEKSMQNILLIKAINHAPCLAKERLIINPSLGYYIKKRIQKNRADCMVQLITGKRYYCL